ncbi:hypothetical protein GCM10028797_18440 [Dyella agri]
MAVVLAGSLGQGAHAATATQLNGAAPATPLLDASKINASQLTTLKGTVSLHAITSTDLGPMAQTKVIPSMTLLLKRGAEQQKHFDAYLASLNVPSSPNFHKWLTAKQVGEQFGPSDQDVATVEKWLESQGLGVKLVTPDKMMIRFSGSVTAVQRAFSTSIHQYVGDDGRVRFANATEQKLPTALTPVVAGVASMTNFFPTPQVKNIHAVKRDSKGHWVAVDGKSSDFNFQFNGQVDFDVVPADFDTIYNVNSLWSQNTPVRGSGQTVAVLERTDVQDADVATFRQTFLPPDAQGMFTQVHPALYVGDTSCADPGTNGDEGEAALDAEWAGAAAPDANVVLASCADTGSDFGPFLAAQNLIFQPAPPAIMSLSYGECEVISAAVGDRNEAAYLWSTAAAEGVTVFVSSGDAGSAGCDQNQPAASFGIAVNGMGNTPYNVSVGGTDFDDLGNQSKYWAPGNGNLGVSAMSYIPEQPWNSSCASSKLYPLLGYSDPNTACNTSPGNNLLNTAAGSGGPSYSWPQPSWQTGVAGMPQTQRRMIPDVSLFAASGIYGHALIFCMSDQSEGGTACNYLNPTDAVYNSAGGTSFAAPAMAGIQALINQKSGVSQGNMAPVLYDLGRKQYGSVGSPTGTCGNDGSGVNCVFHDITVGDIDVPCYAGTADCYSKGNDSYGALSNGGAMTLAPAWKAGYGYDYATGLGSVNVEHLVNAVAMLDARGQAVPTWNFMGLDDSGNTGGFSGRSNVILIDSANGNSTILAMNGGTVVVSVATDSPVFTPGDQLDGVPADVGKFVMAGQPVLETDNATTNTATLEIYGGTGWQTFKFPHPAGWTLVGSGVVDATNVSKEIWRNNSTGQLGFWQVSCGGFYILGHKHAFCGRNVESTIDATAGYTPRLADLNGDGYVDIVWTGPNNDIYYWINDGTGNFTKTYGGTYAAGWELEGAGRIAGSGQTDLIWFNPSTSQLGWWVMNGTQVQDRETRNVTSGYTIASIEDFDGDGLADILWTNSQGDAYVWQGTGGAFVPQHLADGLGNVYTIPAGYVVQKSRLQGVKAMPAQTTGPVIP